MGIGVLSELVLSIGVGSELTFVLASSMGSGTLQSLTGLTSVCPAENELWRCIGIVLLDSLSRH